MLQQKRTLLNVKHPTDTSTSCFISVVIRNSSYTGRKISSTVNKHCKVLNVKIIFSPFKLSTMLSPKDFIPDSLKSRVVYQFTCASCGVRYIGETNRHFNTRVNEYLFRDKNSQIFEHLSASKGCRL